MTITTPEEDVDQSLTSHEGYEVSTPSNVTDRNSLNINVTSPLPSPSHKVPSIKSTKMSFLSNPTSKYPALVSPLLTSSEEKRLGSVPGKFVFAASSNKLYEDGLTSLPASDSREPQLTGNVAAADVVQPLLKIADDVKTLPGTSPEKYSQIFSSDKMQSHFKSSSDEHIPLLQRQEESIYASKSPEKILSHSPSRSDKYSSSPRGSLLIQEEDENDSEDGKLLNRTQNVEIIPAADSFPDLSYSNAAPQALQIPSRRSSGVADLPKESHLTLNIGAESDEEQINN